jgi:hypothetical protein
MAYWLIKTLYHNPGVEPAVNYGNAPESRAELINGAGVDGDWFQFNAMVEADSREAAIVEAAPLMAHEARGRGCSEIVETQVRSFETKEELAAAL